MELNYALVDWHNHLQESMLVIMDVRLKNRESAGLEIIK